MQRFAELSASGPSKAEEDLGGMVPGDGSLSDRVMLIVLSAVIATIVWVARRQQHRWR